jgi:rhamnosyltransferase
MSENNGKPKYGAVFTLFQPPADIFERIRDVIEFCDFVVLVDNTPDGSSISSPCTKIILHKDGINKGLPLALNVGIAKCREMGVNYVVLFDQDSSPTKEILQALFASATEHQTSLVGPVFIDDQAGLARSVYGGNDYSTVSCLPTSGMTFKLDTLPHEIKFNENFFLDFVDFDWCWRLRGFGWTCLQANRIEMRHRLGLAQRKFLFVTYHVPEPYRHYFQFRDAINLTRLSYVPIYSKFRLTVILIPKLLVYPFLLNSGTQRLRWMYLGLRDSFKRIGGVGAARSRLS